MGLDTEIIVKIPEGTYMYGLVDSAAILWQVASISTGDNQCSLIYIYSTIAHTRLLR
jgi:hypothetical protein